MISEVVSKVTAVTDGEDRRTPGSSLAQHSCLLSPRSKEDWMGGLDPIRRCSPAPFAPSPGHRVDHPCQCRRP